MLSLRVIDTGEHVQNKDFLHLKLHLHVKLPHQLFTSTNVHTARFVVGVFYWCFIQSLVITASLLQPVCVSLWNIWMKKLFPFSSLCRGTISMLSLFSVPIQTLHWQRQTLLSICRTPSLPSYPTGKLKRDRKAYFSFPRCFSSCVLSAPLPQTALQ